MLCRGSLGNLRGSLGQAPGNVEMLCPPTDPPPMDGGISDCHEWESMDDYRIVHDHG